MISGLKEELYRKYACLSGLSLLQVSVATVAMHPSRLEEERADTAAFAGIGGYTAAAVFELKQSTCTNWSEYLSGYERRRFAGFFIGDLYRFPVELEAPANGCGFLRALK